MYQKYTGRFLSYSVYYSNGNKDKPYYSVGLLTENGLISVRVHRLVMACFYPQLGSIYQDFDIHHKNGITNDNYISYNDFNRGNLEWMSHSDNIAQSYIMGREPNRIISESTAQEIVYLLSLNKYTSKEIVDIVGKGSSVSIVDDIRKKQCWKHLSKDYDFYQRPSRLFTENDIHNFCRFFEENISLKENGLSVNDICREALKYYDFEVNNRYIETLRKIYNHKYYKHISSQYTF